MKLFQIITMTNLFRILFVIILFCIQLTFSKFGKDEIIDSENSRFNHHLVRNSTIRLERDFHLNSTLALTRTSSAFGNPCSENNLELRSTSLKRVDGSAIEVELDAALPDGIFWYLCSCERIHGQSCDKWMYAGKYTAVSLAPGSSYILFVEDVGTKVFGLRAEGDRVFITEDGFTQIPANVNVTVRVFGANFSSNTALAFTTMRKPRGSRCDNLPMVRVVPISPDNIISDNVAEIEVALPFQTEAKDYFICVTETYEKSDVVWWVHQGDDPWLMLEPVGRLLPMWLQICLILCLLCLSGLFSGLNLGLMALDRLELQVIENCGTKTEKKYARTISPLRNRGNYLLCSLLLGNVLVNSTLTILLDDLTSGIIAIVGSTMSIVVIGEIIPQALCSRHGLSIGARTVWITKFFMLATFPLSFPISKILDCVLGEEIGNVYDRERLMEYIRVTKPYNKLENEEVNIISGALELKTKTVANVMTKIEDVFMIPYDAILNFETMSVIMKQGYSRIPVFDGDRNNIVALLNIKDLAFVDPDDNTLLRTLCEFYNHPINYVFEDETLDVMLNEFKKGQSHMAFVRHVNNEGDGDPFYEIIGVVTLEDVIEEILQSEIIDETDILTDNRRKQRRKEAQIKQDFSEFAKIGGGQQGRNVISPQLALATYQYLSTSVEPFKKFYLSETVLKRLMSQNIFFNVKQSSCSKDEGDSSSVLYEAGKSANYFILILEGRCRVTVGKENLVFETGPFSYFGLPALALNSSGSGEFQAQSSSQACIRNSALSISESVASRTFVPDYTVTAVGPTLYMKIHWTVYLAAYRATIMERQKLDPNLEYCYQSAWENDFFSASSPTDNSVRNISPPSTSSRKTKHNHLINKSSKQGSKCHDSTVRRASVEVGCVSRCPESVIVLEESFSMESKDCIAKSPGFAVPVDIPMIDMCHNLSCVVENDCCQAVEPVELKKKRTSDNSVKKVPQVNGTKEATNERTRLLYPSEA